MTYIEELAAADLAAVRAVTSRAELEAYVRDGGRLEGLLAQAFPDLAALALAMRERALAVHEFEQFQLRWTGTLITHLPAYAGAERG